MLCQKLYTEELMQTAACSTTNLAIPNNIGLYTNTLTPQEAQMSPAHHVSFSETQAVVVLTFISSNSKQTIH